jgi:ABC-type nitrate/sulfonate/bicarbonate transport system ATPase subunit
MVDPHGVCLHAANGRTCVIATLTREEALALADAIVALTLPPKAEERPAGRSPGRIADARNIVASPSPLA